MIAYSMMVVFPTGGTTSGVCTPSMNEDADSSYSRPVRWGPVATGGFPPRLA